MRARAWTLLFSCAALAAGCKDTSKSAVAPEQAPSAAAERGAAERDVPAKSPAPTAPPTADASASPAATAPAGSETAGFEPTSLDPYTKRPLYYTRELRAEDTRDRSLRELSLMRNWIFARAGNAFRKEWLASFFGAYDWYRPREKQDLSVLTEYDKKNAATIAAAEAAVSEEELRRDRDALVEKLRADPGYPKSPAHPDDVIELSLLAARLGEWVEPKPGAETASPLEDPQQLDKLLKLSDLRDLSRRELRLLRNMIYARHGRPFQSQSLQMYFGDMEWYAPDERYSDARLTAIDKKNIQLVQSVENEVGGPLSEHEHMLEEYGTDWLGAA